MNEELLHAATQLAAAYRASIVGRKKHFKAAATHAKREEIAGRLNQLEPDLFALLVGLGLTFLQDASLARGVRPDTDGKRWAKKYPARSAPAATTDATAAAGRV